ncbi:MAG: hypothetical protein LBL79_00230, partial [Prevotella sp.]|nr:hypothetical protein [Prevotella sp.]
MNGGYYESGNYYFYINDHLGNNRIVTDAAASVVQSTQYYPFGTSFADATGTSTQPYKYNGKELDARNGMNMYDSGARFYDPVIPRTPTPDPHAENYYAWSPYAWVGNKPMRIIDPTGMDWYQDADGTYQYSRYLTEKTKDLYIAFFAFLGKEISYIGATYQETD